MKKFFRLLSIVCFICSFLLFFIIELISYKIPNDYTITEHSGMGIQSYLPISAKLDSNEEVDVIYKNNINKSYNAIAMIANVIPVKNVNVHVSEDIKMIPCGNPFGIKLFTEGVMVVGISDVQTRDNLVSPAKVSGLKKGDVIISINDQGVNSNADIAKIVESSNGNQIKVVAKRNNVKFDTTIVPQKSFADDVYKIGLWVRDSSAGIGTLTFFDPSTNLFVGLGHGVCDVDTGELLPLMHGDIVGASIGGIVKAIKGNPGELRGTFKDNVSIGNIVANINSGVYGYMKNSPSNNHQTTVAMKQQVKTGKAQVLTTINGDMPKYYDIEIISVNYNEFTPTKNMVISITDKELLENAGGIVQGMSGSPIIQNDMLIGAVTHVFVNDPVRGYAIFAENMINDLQKVCNFKYKSVS